MCEIRNEGYFWRLSSNNVRVLSALCVIGIVVTLGSLKCNDNSSIAFSKDVPVIAENKEDNSNIEKIVEVPINSECTVTVGMTKDAEVSRGGYHRAKPPTVEASKIQQNDTNVNSMQSLVDEAANQRQLEILREQEEQRRIAEDLERQQRAKELKYLNNGGLLEIANPDPNYKGTAINISGEERDLLERLVMGEAGGQGFEGAALVAQCIRDVMVTDGISSVEQVRQQLRYSGGINKEPNDDVKKAVSHIFDNGGYAVKHRIIYFYAPRWMKSGTSSFHESQVFVIEYGGHKVFDRR